MYREIKKACEILKKGGIILYPTDTIWGIGCDATNENAVNKIFFIKKRYNTKAMLVLLDSFTKLHNYVHDFSINTFDLLNFYCEKPLTIIYPGAKNVAPNLIAHDGTLGIRVTKESFSKQLCCQLNNPLVSTSANISGYPAPINFPEISNEIIQSVDYVVDYRKNEINSVTSSTIISLKEKRLAKIIRK
ncbi:MAG: threonylcarbamoyl-AMP synthase [Bacteroidales bacterium OttesenSCG-928-I14]|jgi:L-threonylcarbamoyladenylate synthase|nr:threonylcarbamoyl-AMP synthase [Bacteroidales bacterium OttesenSCG-928-I14]